MVAIGSLKVQVSGGPNPLYGSRPIYGTRDEYLPLAKRTMFQVLIAFLGTPMWINVERGDVTLHP